MESVDPLGLETTAKVLRVCDRIFNNGVLIGVLPNPTHNSTEMLAERWWFSWVYHRKLNTMMRLSKSVRKEEEELSTEEALRAIRIALS